MIGYYVHHHGRGHLARATSICAHLREPVTILTSLVTHELPGISTVRLPRDDEEAPPSAPTEAERCTGHPCTTRVFANAWP